MVEALMLLGTGVGISIEAIREIQNAITPAVTSSGDGITRKVVVTVTP
ncbi:MAG: hypothetical protein U0872_01900 [Planctomycetaceae bacterium]